MLVCCRTSRCWFLNTSLGTDLKSTVVHDPECASYLNRGCKWKLPVCWSSSLPSPLPTIGATSTELRCCMPNDTLGGTFSHCSRPLIHRVQTRAPSSGSILAAPSDRALDHDSERRPKPSTHTRAVKDEATDRGQKGPDLTACRHEAMTGLGLSDCISR